MVLSDVAAEVSMKTKQIHLLKRPDKISVSDFAMREVELPDLQGDQVLVEN